MTRAIVTLTVILVGLAGCSGSSSAPAPGGSGAPPQPSAGEQQHTPPAAADPHQMDPAKHVIPDKPAAGRLAGKPFTPDRVEVERNKITFRQGKEFFADLEVEVNLAGDKLPAGGAKLVVGTAPGGAGGVQSVQTSVRAGEGLPKTTDYSTGYALTLELGKAAGGKVPGKVYLALPDAEKSYLAGTFEAEVVRGLDQPPGPDDVPYIKGTVAHKGQKGQMLWVAYAGIAPDGKVVTDGVGTQAVDGGIARSLTSKPRAATLNPTRTPAEFDFTRLPPGRYLVAARLADGPTAWTWVEVKAGGTPAAALTLDPARVGTVKVKVPTGDAKARVVLIPEAEGTAAAGLDFVNSASFVLDYSAEPKDGTATIPNVAPGKYTARYWSGGKPHTAAVEVAAGKTATTEIKPADDKPKDEKSKDKK